jgi:hypothetical protein
MSVNIFETMPKCLCGMDWPAGVGHLNVECVPPFAIDNYTCTRCGRIATRQGFADTNTCFVLVSKRPASEFGRTVSRWVRGPISKVFRALHEANALDTIISMPNPYTKSVALFFPNEVGNWKKMV